LARRARPQTYEGELLLLLRPTAPASWLLCGGLLRRLPLSRLLALLRSSLLPRCLLRGCPLRRLTPLRSCLAGSLLRGRRALLRSALLGRLLCGPTLLRWHRVSPPLHPW